jgi:hypothetical protein
VFQGDDDDDDDDNNNNNNNNKYWGTIKKALDQYLRLLPGYPSTLELQKMTLMSTKPNIRKVLG